MRSDAVSGELIEGARGARRGFSAYLDGALDGRTMAQLAAHMRECALCATEFEAWRAMQEALGELGPAQVPKELQARLRDALASEIVTGRYLSPFQRFRGVLPANAGPCRAPPGCGFGGDPGDPGNRLLVCGHRRAGAGQRRAHGAPECTEVSVFAGGSAAGHRRQPVCGRHGRREGGRNRAGV